MGMRMQIKVLVTHTEPVVEAGLAATLEREPDIAVWTPETAGSADAGSAWIARQAVDVVVTDFRRGLRLAATLAGSTARTLVVSGRATQTEIRTALEQGVIGCLSLDSPAVEIVDAVRKAHRGQRHVSQPLAALLLEDLVGERLTPRETEVLRLAGEGCANKVIASRLRVEVGTVKCHMKAVMDKLGARNRTEAVVIASRRGLLALDGARSAASGRPMHAADEHGSHEARA